MMLPNDLLNTSEWEAFIRAVRQGGDIETACLFAGLPPRHLVAFLEKGKDAYERGSKARTTATAVEAWVTLSQARAGAIMTAVRKVQDADDWKAQKWWLETQVGGAFGKSTAFNEGRATPQLEGGSDDRSIAS